MNHELSSMNQPGKLYLVPTPIGNLEDMTFRAVRILKEADLILAEDTRTSAPMLKHFGVTARVFAHHQHNEHQSSNEIIRFLNEGKQIALISDAGTPAISDPGFYLVREALKHDIAVECLPGPTAFVPALVNSGFPTDKFCFEGFLPLKKGRQTRYKQLAEEDRTIILYESPHRLLKTLEEMATYFGADRLISVSRELTKMFEETVRGTVAEVKTHFETHPVKGEFVICVMGNTSPKSSPKERTSKYRDDED
ncbi:16S rRNA (cytidine1402-2'-O)-methyltransferase [Mucilaginibacter yixingensis]|uniref:Ribosomal RNA small subunit methyltransferase I n=2 Tax=Mucilaginibacter yixingensis TaxID=1295612 RepID=A0A2T5J5D4_9SPHI|nr:16S rRNA (cytidine(1402)-2'-O)-methyltransferase [Mucilaginibacter yixingensis]PTQ93198.1 16S rRNA (cytidine1402-2'-O)-methyltransferase [Mucilaginibacter yixingensis]